MNTNAAITAPVDSASPVAEAKFHTYRTHAVPLVVHVIWILFWIGAVYYFVNYLLPALQIEVTSPP